MGRDKALLDMGGQPLALRIAELLSRVSPQVSIVGDPALYCSLGLPVIPDNLPGLGPLSGIEAALGATQADWNLIVASDMPSLDAATLESLFEGKRDGAAPRYPDGMVEPLCAVYHRRCHAAILRALNSGVRRASDALKTLELTYIPVTSSAPFANLNTPADVNRFASRKPTHG
jgi:molybdopterin-guanine dinucleotide biosynthesis protein A